MPISPTQAQIQTAIRTFLLDVLPAGIDAVIAIQNRVPELMTPNFVIISPLQFDRLAVNIDTYADVQFVGSIAPQSASITGSIAPAPPIPNAMTSGILTVASVESGSVVIGGALSGVGVLSGTQVAAQLSGTTGGIGTYAVNLSQNVPSTAISESYGLMTVSAVVFGIIKLGAVVFGVGVTASTIIQSQVSGTSGGIGTYIVSPGQTISSEKLAAGAKLLQQNVRFTCQLDFHSGDYSAADMAQVVSTVLRDEIGTAAFAAQNPNYGVVPLYADNPRDLSFINENQQAEWRFELDAEFQVNQLLIWPSQFADALHVTPIGFIPLPQPSGFDSGFSEGFGSQTRWI